MANGKIVYPSGDAAAITYTFVKNYDYKPDLGDIEVHDNQRSFDGTLNSFAGATKKSFELAFSYTLKAQFDLFRNLYRFHCAIDLYLDGDSGSPDAVVYMMTAPRGGPEPAFSSPGVPTYSFSVRFEEV